MDTEKLLNYCYTSADRKFDTAKSLYKNRRYADCLFFCHLSLEFMLKGKYVEIKKEMFPITHDLVGLATRAGLLLTEDKMSDLAVISTFNIAARYDDYKSSFYKKANAVFTKKYFAKVRKLLIWLKKNTLKK